MSRVVIDTFKFLFGDYSILLPKSKIVTFSGKGTIPDGIIIDFKNRRWFILEVERGCHDTWEHIAKQINRQLVAVRNPVTKNKIADLCISEIGKQVEFTDLLATDLKISAIGIHGCVQKILEMDPIVSLPIDYSPKDLEEWADGLKYDVRIQHIEKYMSAAGDVLYDFPDLETTQDVEDLKSTDKSNALAEIVKANVLKVGDKVYFDYGPKGSSKKRFEGKICTDGIEVGGVVSSASVSALRCIQQLSPSRTTANGWATWKTADGKLLEEKWKAFLSLNGEESKLKKGKKKGKKKGEKKGKNEPATPESSEVMGEILQHRIKGGAVTATIKKTGESFVLLAGSKLALDYNFRASGWLEVRRNAKIKADGTLLKDIECSSSSMAACLVAGGERNGNKFWKK